jgi:hypothetical protein
MCILCSLAEVKRYIRTVKDRLQSTYQMLPFQVLTKDCTSPPVEECCLLVTCIPAQGWCNTEILIMTSQHLSYEHAVMEFGAYVQKHEEHTNNMSQHTMGCICLGPTGNWQGAHWFMYLSLGEQVMQYGWTELLMPREVIDQVSTICHCQHMLPTIAYADCHGNEIGNTINKLEEDASDNDSLYLDSHQEDDSMTSDFDDRSSYGNDLDNDNDNEDNNDFGSWNHQPCQHNLPLGGQQQPCDDSHDDDQLVQVNNDECAGNSNGDDHGSKPNGCEKESTHEDQLLDEVDKETLLMKSSLLTKMQWQQIQECKMQGQQIK